MTIAPIVRTVTVATAPARTFELFTAHYGAWWPKGKTPAKAQHVEIIVEPCANGRWFERDAEGVQTQWGKVLAWEPPHRLLLGWQLNSHFEYDPDFLNEVEVTFQPDGQGGTVVRLEHRDLERYGADAERLATQINGGWGDKVEQFAAYVANHH